MIWRLSATALVLGLVVNAAATAQVPAEAPAPPSFTLRDFGTVLRPSTKGALLGLAAVQDELRLSTARRTEIEASRDRKFEEIEKARREIPDREKFLAARDSGWKAWLAAVLRDLEPWQRDRLAQIQLQVQGPLAFSRSRLPVLAVDGPDLAERLEMTKDQVRRVVAIVEEGDKEIDRAAVVPVLIPKSEAPIAESIRTLVASPTFKAAKQKARENASKARTSVTERIEQVLTEPQRTAYRKMLGAPFDQSRIRLVDEATEDIALVTSALNPGRGGQQADPNFDTRVARPAYVAEHPRVLFDEAHNNFHTTTGRYKPFAQVIANDGYKIIPSKEKFTGDLLARGDILIIANALGAERAGQPGAASSAFTEAECDAVRDWVRAGGSLLLITDHIPFGAAAESLAGRFGVEMSKGYTSDPSNSEGSPTSLMFTRKNNLLGDHPITKGRDESERVNRVQTFTGQSLKGPVGSVAFLKLGDTAFDEGADGKPIPAAGRAQGVAFVFGQGRVVVLGEAAELSAQVIGTRQFGMNVPGLDNRQMAINILHWLSGLLEPRDGLRN